MPDYGMVKKEYIKFKVMADNNQNPDNNNNKDDSNRDLRLIIIAGWGGAFLASIIDNMTNGSASITAKFLSRFFPDNNELISQLYVALGVGLIGAFICWIYTPKTRPEAFIKGLTIFAILNISNPYPGDGSAQLPKSNANDISKHTTIVFPETQHKQILSFQAGFLNFDQQQKDTISSFKPNATIQKFSATEWVSDIKPYTTFSSFFNGKIYFRVAKGEVLKENQKVQIIDYYFTPVKEYKYVKIRYQDEKGQYKEGWIKAGKKSEWSYVIPNNTEDKKFHRDN